MPSMAMAIVSTWWSLSEREPSPCHTAAPRTAPASLWRWSLPAGSQERLHGPADEVRDRRGPAVRSRVVDVHVYEPALRGSLSLGALEQADPVDHGRATDPVDD